MIANFKTASSLLWRIDTVIFGKLNNLIKAPPPLLDQTIPLYLAPPPPSNVPEINSHTSEGELNRGFTVILKNHIRKKFCRYKGGRK